MDQEVKAQRLVLEDADGRRTTIEPGSVVIDGGPTRGMICLSLCVDGAALIDLYTCDGSNSVKLKAAADASGLSVQMPNRGAGLTAAGLAIIGEQQTLEAYSDRIAIRAAADKRTLAALPFPLASAGGLFNQARTWLAGKLSF